MGVRLERMKRALYVGRVARRTGLLRVLRELGVWGARPATREGAQEFRHALEQLGTTYIKLGQLLSSRPDLLPDVYIEELYAPSSPAATRSITMCGSLAYGLRRRSVRTTSAQSSERIICSGGTGAQSVMGVSTKPGLSAVARTPCCSSARFSVFVNWITPAFAAP